MARVVADTNVLISAVVADGKPRRFLRKCISGEVTLVTSTDLLQEFVEVLHRPKFKMAEDEVHRAMGVLVEISDVVIPTSQFRVVVEDPDDDAVLNAAHGGRAEWIVSGDKHLLELKQFKGIKIVRVADFLDAIP